MHLFDIDGPAGCFRHDGGRLRNDGAGRFLEAELSDSTAMHMLPAGGSLIETSIRKSVAVEPAASSAIASWQGVGAVINPVTCNAAGAPGIRFTQAWTSDSTPTLSPAAKDAPVPARRKTIAAWSNRIPGSSFRDVAAGTKVILARRRCDRFREGRTV
jgi:hypothetical protein